MVPSPFLRDLDFFGFDVFPGNDGVDALIASIASGGGARGARTTSECAPPIHVLARNVPPPMVCIVLVAFVHVRHLPLSSGPS